MKAVSGAMAGAFSSWLCGGGALGSNLGMGRVTRVGRLLGIETPAMSKGACDEPGVGESPDMSSGNAVAADFGSEGACDEPGVGDAGDWVLHDWINCRGGSVVGLTRYSAYIVSIDRLRKL